MPTSNISSEQINLLRSVFFGRWDVYGMMGPKGPLCIREPLTDELLAKHLSGVTRIGQYALLKDSTIQWACIDIDEMVREKVERIVVSCAENNLFPYVERSRSKGYHVWLFFDEPIKAQSVRKVLSKVLKDADAEDCEVFPKQDSLTSDNGVGNFVFLPLQGDSVKEKKTIFVDSQLEPHENQWGQLTKVHRTKAENILSKAEEIPDEPNPDQQKSSPTAEGSVDVANYLIHYNIPFQEKKESTRKIFQLTKCPWAGNHTEGDGKGHAAIIQGNDGKITFHCFHKHCEDRTWTDARKIISRDDPIFQFCEGYTPPPKTTTDKAKKSGIELKLTTISEVYEYPDLNYLIEDTIPEETVNAIGGYTGVGKSMVVLDLIKSVATGKPFLGKYGVSKSGAVLIVDEETPRPLLRDRIRKMKFDPSWPVYFLHFQDIKIDKEQVFNALMEKIKEVKPVLVVFDSLIRIHRKREKESEEMAQVIDALRKIANWGTTVIIIHHHKKGGGPLTEKLRGSSDIPGGIDVEFALTPEKEGSDILLFQSVKTRIKPFPPIRIKLNITEDTAAIEYCGTINETILDVVVGILSKENDFLTIKQITEKLIEAKFDDFKEYEIRKALKEGERLKILKSGEIKVGKSKATTYKVNDDSRTI